MRNIFDDTSTNFQSQTNTNPQKNFFLLFLSRYGEEKNGGGRKGELINNFLRRRDYSWGECGLTLSSKAFSIPTKWYLRRPTDRPTNGAEETHKSFFLQQNICASQRVFFFRVCGCWKKKQKLLLLLLPTEREKTSRLRDWRKLDDWLGVITANWTSFCFSLLFWFGKTKVIQLFEFPLTPEKEQPRQIISVSSFDRPNLSGRENFVKRGQREFRSIQYEAEKKKGIQGRASWAFSRKWTKRVGNKTSYVNEERDEGFKRFFAAFLAPRLLMETNCIAKEAKKQKQLFRPRPRNEK